MERQTHYVLHYINGSMISEKEKEKHTELKLKRDGILKGLICQYIIRYPGVKENLTTSAEAGFWTETTADISLQ